MNHLSFEIQIDHLGIRAFSDEIFVWLKKICPSFFWVIKTFVNFNYNNLDP